LGFLRDVQLIDDDARHSKLQANAPDLLSAPAFERLGDAAQLVI
jgi:hypothetical protein